MFWQRWLYKDALEILDQEGLSARGLASHAELERFNRRLGWTRRHLGAVMLWWEALGRPEPFRVLDVGAGTGAFGAAVAAECAARARAQRERARHSAPGSADPAAAGAAVGPPPPSPPPLHALPPPAAGRSAIGGGPCAFRLG